MNAQGTSEYEIKSAFILNFLKFTELPVRDLQSISLCIFGDDGVYNIAKVLQNKRVGERALAVTLVKNISDLNGCDALFIPRSASKFAGEILRAVKGHTILTVGEDQVFFDAGGMIALVSDENKIRFIVTPEIAQREHINFSAKLLALAINKGK